MHSLAVSQSGTVYSWGYGVFGQLGHGTLNDELAPRVVEALREIKIVSVATGLMHSLALTETGDVFSWGYNVNGQLGHGEAGGCLPTPKLVEALQGVRLVSVRAGFSCSAAVSKDGAIYSWGEGGDGCLGHDDEEDQHTPTLLEDFHALGA